MFARGAKEISTINKQQTQIIFSPLKICTHHDRSLAFRKYKSEGTHILLVQDAQKLHRMHLDQTEYVLTQ